ncbi:MAG: class I SAM-dependent methyltransferase [Novosphingobium sp.]
MTNAADWQGTVGRSWAQKWQKTDTSFCELTPHLLAAISSEPGSRIVDIGCGAGELSLAVARARPDADVTGIDISGDLVEAARARAAQPNVSFVEVDASVWQPDDAAPDLFVSRHGVMFFPDPPRAFGHLASVAAPDARIVFSCFRKAAENAWAARIAELLPPAPAMPAPTPAERFAPGPFAFAEPDHVRACMAGWRDLAFTPVDFAYVAGAGADPVGEAMALFRRIGPAAAALRTLPQKDREVVEARLLTLVEAHLVDGRVSFPAAAWLVSATSDHRNG